VTAARIEPSAAAGLAAGRGLQVEGLTKRFTRHAPPAVDDVSFHAPSGSLTTLLGPSGSGKSTVLRLLAGLEYPDAGRILVDGADGTHVPPQRRGVGFVFQSYALFNHLDVRDNIAFGLKGKLSRAEGRQARRAEIDRQVDELLAAVELPGYGGRLPGQLSGGQRQRVAFARALAVAPRLLLLDEPFGALDASVRVSLREWLRRFHESRQGDPHHPPVTTILVTHDQDEAMELSDTIVVMNQGRVEQIGSPSEIYDRPATPFVAGFVGGANVLRGRVTSEGAAVHAFVRPHEIRLSKALPVPEQGPAADPEAGAGGLALAQVDRLAFVGAYVKVTLRLPDQETLTVELGKQEFEALHIQTGDRVMADLAQAKIFLADYAI
jgi:sulfate transport system ATP-binding protein